MELSVCPANNLCFNEKIEQVSQQPTYVAPFPGYSQILSQRSQLLDKICE